MEENESKDGKSLEKELQNDDKIKKAIEIAILNNKKEVKLEDGLSIISLKLIKNKENEIYSVQFDEDTDIARVKKTENGVKYDYYNSNVIKKIPNEFDLNRAKIRIEEEQREKLEIKKAIEQDKNPRDISKEKIKQEELLNGEIERGLQNGSVVEMEMDREFSTTENMRMFVKRAFGISALKIYRKQGKDPHDFKYIAKTESGHTEEIDLSSQREGRNSGQKICLMENGEMKEKAVDSIMIRGNYAIATDIPDDVMSDNTRTYLCTITPSGRYLAIAAGQKQGVNRNTSGDVKQKDFMSRSNTVYELEDIIDSAQLAEKIYGLTKDGKLTTNEIAMVKKFKIDKNINDKEVINVINAITSLKEMGYNHSQIKQIIDNVKNAPTDEKVALKLAKEVKQEEYSDEKTMFDDLEHEKHK